MSSLNPIEFLCSILENQIEKKQLNFILEYKVLLIMTKFGAFRIQAFRRNKRIRRASREKNDQDQDLVSIYTFNDEQEENAGDVFMHIFYL